MGKAKPGLTDMREDARAIFRAALAAAGRDQSRPHLQGTGVIACNLF